MRKSWHRRSGSAAPWVVVLTSLLVLLGLALGACRSEEKPAEPTPAETPAETPPASEAETPAVTPMEITITGKMPPPAWDKAKEPVGVGDTIVWKIGNGRHSVRFSNPSACTAAQAKMTFDPPLVNCESAKKQTPGDVIVRATVNQALDADLEYVCGVHSSMTGLLEPK